MAKAVLVDLTRCIGCRGCQVACKEWNERVARPTIQSGTYENPMALSSDCYTRIKFVEKKGKDGPIWDFVKDQCLHCNDPACVSACPVGALVKTDAGPVSYKFDRCIGCRYCMVACPFEIPKYEWEKTMPWVRKCTFCSERIGDGLQPSCVQTCPTGALFYGENEMVTAKAKERFANDRKLAPEVRRNYTGEIYGEKEAGGTAWKYIADRPFGELGFNTRVGDKSLPSFTWAHLGKIPLEIVGFAAVLGGLAFIKGRDTKGGE
jgi:formate dehydrogenase iron-sulfur subunit